MQKTKILILFFIFFISQYIFSQHFINNNPLVNTYSIVAYDAERGEMGVAVQSHWFSVGSVVGWAESGVGVIATQSLVNVSFGPRGLELLKQGLSPQQAIDNLISQDEGRDYRQLAVLDAKGNAASYTGSKCIKEAGNKVGKNYSVQANLMLNSTVWDAMAEAFENAEGPLAERMIAAFEAAEKEGGDIRGKQSASILIVKINSSGKIWEDKLIDLRVEDHPKPVEELKRLLKVHRAYEHMNAGDLAVEKGDMELALKEYSTAEEIFSGYYNDESKIVPEMKFWHAVTLANNGKIDESIPLFKDIFKENENWKILLPRLIEPGLLTISEENLNKILSISY